MMYHIKLLGHNTQRKKVKMSKDLLSAAHQVLSSNELEIQELVNRISAARYLDEETKEKIINELSAATLDRAAKASKGELIRGYKFTQAADKKKAGAQKTLRKAGGLANLSPSDAQKYYTDKGNAPTGWGVKDGKVYKK